MTTTIHSLLAQKEQARTYLNTNYVGEALTIYTQILADYPEDIDGLLAVGDCYLAAEQIPAALKLYRRASAVDPDHPGVQRRLMLVQLEPESYSKVTGNGSLLEPQMISYLARELNGMELNGMEGKSVTETPISIKDGSAPEMETPNKPNIAEEEIEHASRILNEVLNSSTPALTVTERLAEIDALIPALLELNVRHAREKVHPGLEQSLQEVIQRVPYGNQNGKTANGNGCPRPGADSPSFRILFVHPKGMVTPARQTLPAQVLKTRGCVVTFATSIPSARLDEFDVIVAHRPHADPDLMEGLAQRVAAKVPVVVDVDLDFEQLPLNHPDQATFGLETPAQARLYVAAMLMADWVAVTGEELGGMLRNRGHRVQVIPDGWSRRNPLWEKPATPRHTLNLGWVASPGQVEDATVARRMVLRILREFPHTQLVVVGDPQVYQLFDGLPEARRLFLPPSSEEDYPYSLSQMDILLVPMRQTPFNLTCSDRVLMEAGVREIPWVASPIPAFTAWAEGGLIAHSPEEWYSLLHRLITDWELRRDLGRAGKARAAAREVELSGEPWWDLIQSCVRQRV